MRNMLSPSHNLPRSSPFSPLVAVPGLALLHGLQLHELPFLLAGGSLQPHSGSCAPGTPPTRSRRQVCIVPV